MSLPSGVRTVGIGSAVLGGAGKTLVAISYAQAYRAAGARVAFVAHGYNAAVRDPMVCEGNEDVQAVGDDTLVAARMLHGSGIEVWVGSDRNLTLREAARHSEIVVVDGLLQSRPRTLDRSVIVLDAASPFGSGACPPAGDLRGPVPALLSLCDEVVFVRDGFPRCGTCAEPIPWQSLLEHARQSPHGFVRKTQQETLREGRRKTQHEMHQKTHPHAVSQSLRELLRDFSGNMLPNREIFERTAWLDVLGLSDGSRILPVSSVAQNVVGFASLMAHPERVLTTLRLRGVVPACVWHGPDHGPLTLRDQQKLRDLAREFRISAWLVSTKCATHFASSDIGAPLLSIEITSRLDPMPHAVLDCAPCVPQDFLRS